MRAEIAQLAEPARMMPLNDEREEWLARRRLRRLRNTAREVDGVQQVGLCRGIYSENWLTTLNDFRNYLISAV